MNVADRPIGTGNVEQEQLRPNVDRRITFLLLLAGILLMGDSAHLLNRFLPEKEENPGKCQRLEIRGGSHYLAAVACLSSNDPFSHQATESPYTPFSFEPIPINRADPELLMTVRGIGPKLAEKIYRYRQENGPLTKGSDLAAIPGIGEKSAARFAPHFNFTPPP